MPSERLVSVSSPLGDALRFRRAMVTENLGRLHEIEVDVVSDDPEIALQDLLGQHMTIRLVLPEDAERFFDGVVSRFSLVGTVGRDCLYRATLRPWLWLLTRTSDCRIFQNMTAPDIIKDVIRDSGFTDFDERLDWYYDYTGIDKETGYPLPSKLREVGLHHVAEDMERLYGNSTI